VDSDDIETQLNQFGAEGWDLFQISEILKDAGVTAMIVATMRRPLIKQANCINDGSAHRSRLFRNLKNPL